jgi:hypothetical protein
MMTQTKAAWIIIEQQDSAQVGRTYVNWGDAMGAARRHPADDLRDAATRV